MFTLQLNILQATFLLVSYSNTFLDLLLPVTNTFVRLYNYCLFLTMMFSETRVNNEKFPLKRSVAEATMSQGLPI